MYYACRALAVPLPAYPASASDTALLARWACCSRRWT